MMQILHIFLYVFICFLSLVILDVIKHDNPIQILRKSSKNFAILTGIFVGISLLLHLVHLAF